MPGAAARRPPRRVRARALPWLLALGALAPDVARAGREHPGEVSVGGVGLLLLAPGGGERPLLRPVLVMRYDTEREQGRRGARVEVAAGMLGEAGKSGDRWALVNLRLGMLSRPTPRFVWVMSIGARLSGLTSDALGPATPELSFCGRRSGEHFFVEVDGALALPGPEAALLAGWRGRHFEVRAGVRGVVWVMSPWFLPIGGPELALAAVF